MENNYLLDVTQQRAFRLILGRDPGGPEEQARLAACGNFALLRQYLLGVRAQELDAVMQRTATLPVIEEDLRVGFQLLIGRYPDGPGVTRSRLRSGQSALGLVEGLLAARGFRRQIDAQNVLAAVDPAVPAMMVFLHVPRCAGTSFDDYCRSNFGREYYLEREELNFDADRIRGKRLIGGHFRINFWDPLRTERIFLSILRHPVARALSLFQYYRFIDIQPQHAARREYRETLGFRGNEPMPTMVESNMANEFTGNVQCRFLSAQSDVEAAWHSIRHNPFIVTTVNHLDRLAAHLHDHYGFGQAGYPKVNTSPRVHDPVSLGLGPADMEALRSANAADIELYERIDAEGLIDTVSEPLRKRFRGD